ncbi:MAG TPA: hypothetical protein VN634_15945 [Candidatus Limnocylindrales bacterium]|nr:hypothetical protein [Candidatus Limnocylindrales bacterium]
MAAPSVLVHQSWRVSKKDTAAVLLRKVLDASSSLGPPTIDMLATDSPVGSVSATARAVKKHGELFRFARDVQLPGSPASVRGLSTSASQGRIAIPSDLVLAVLDGVPRSFPFNQVGVMLSWDTPEKPQLRITDMWWINGRNRSLTLTWTTEADPASKALPQPSEELHLLVDALGKPKSTTRQPAGDALTVAPRNLLEIARRYRSGMRDLAATLDLPHAFAAGGIGEAAGPMKPLLVETFGPRGYDCRGEHGAFTLRRRTPSNHVVELSLDVGTWSHSFTGFLIVHVPGFRASVPLPVSPGTLQTPIAGAAGWKGIVENLAIIVDALEKSFVSDIEREAGTAPAWFDPG